MKTNPTEFIRQVRQEANKVTWPSRKETLVTGAMVFVMVALFGAFFLVVDQALSFLVRLILVRG
jgi:preprotein translocase subunit SecE